MEKCWQLLKHFDPCRINATSCKLIVLGQLIQVKGQLSLFKLMPWSEFRNQITDNLDFSGMWQVKQVANWNDRGSQHSNPSIPLPAPRVPKLHDGL